MSVEKRNLYTVNELRKPDPELSGERLLYPIFFFLGVGSLFPWNAFINANAYYASRFCGTARADDFLSFFGVIFNVSSVACLCCCVKYGWKQVVTPLVIYALAFVGKNERKEGLRTKRVAAKRFFDDPH